MMDMQDQLGATMKNIMLYPLFKTTSPFREITVTSKLSRPGLNGTACFKSGKPPRWLGLFVNSLGLGAGGSCKALLHGIQQNKIQVVQALDIKELKS